MVKENTGIPNNKKYTEPLVTPFSSSFLSLIPNSASINDIVYFVNLKLAQNEIHNVINNI